MKRILLLLTALLPIYTFAQKKLPVVKASVGQAKIYEQENAVSNWYINPKIKPDVFTTGKFTKSKRVKFKTDIDSIVFSISPGQKKEFIVLLNGKDSCLTQITALALKNLNKVSPEIHDSIPFFVNKFNTNFLPVVLNGTDSLLLNFDSGANDIDLTNAALSKKVKSKLKLYDTEYGIKIGNHTYKSKIFDIELAGNETDGLLGWDIFDGMIVALDYDQNKMMVHSTMPKEILQDKQYTRFKITYIKNKPFIESEISQSGIKNKSLFMVDLGYQRTAMLDNDLLREMKFPTEKMEVIKKVMMHGTRGNEVPVTTVKLQSLKIGNFELKNVPAQVMEQNKPMPGVSVHYFGTDILKRFNTVFDFQNNVIYLKPNHLYDVAYADQKS
ncbi:aspartyl protease family protein [Pedobacter sp. D749]|uniref:aspartyl protease family protein n=1 Tax=Pedobacter sp. D749 TaxID=2856523 RepID=UPI001C59465B|nr:aspartyl protease family protein [Pedobacter sp. D749]QXU41875.1 retroviral-like aspartic protease family protein [Pedobacter sp. D749]